MAIYHLDGLEITTAAAHSTNYELAKFFSVDGEPLHQASIASCGVPFEKVPTPLYLSLVDAAQSGDKLGLTRVLRFGGFRQAASGSSQPDLRPPSCLKSPR